MIQKSTEYKVSMWDNVEGKYFVRLDLSMSTCLLRIFFFPRKQKQ